MLILGTWYLYLRVLRLHRGEVCCKRTCQYADLFPCRGCSYSCSNFLFTPRSGKMAGITVLLQFSQTKKQTTSISESIPVSWTNNFVPTGIASAIYSLVKTPMFFPVSCIVFIWWFHPDKTSLRTALGQPKGPNYSGTSEVFSSFLQQQFATIPGFCFQFQQSLSRNWNVKCWGWL